MGLDSYKSEPTRVGEKDKHRKAKLCPNCGKEGEHLRGNEWRCTTEYTECDTLWWIHTDYMIEDAKMH